VPFSVAWIRLGVNGARAVAHRGFYPFGRLERRFLLAEFLLVFACFVPGTIATVFIIAGFAKETQHLSALVKVVAVLLGAGMLVLVLIVAIRFSLAIAAVALQRYTGLRAAWQLGKGLTLRIIAIAILAFLPFMLALGICDALQTYLASSVWVLLPAVLYVACEQLIRASSAGSLAIVYRFATSSARSSTPLAPADLQDG
jgi:hypothetical protein